MIHADMVHSKLAEFPTERGMGSTTSDSLRLTRAACLPAVVAWQTGHRKLGSIAIFVFISFTTDLWMFAGGQIVKVTCA